MQVKLTSTSSNIRLYNIVGCFMAKVPWPWGFDYYVSAENSTFAQWWIKTFLKPDPEHHQNVIINSLAEVVIKVEGKIKDSGLWSEISLSATKTRIFYEKKKASSVLTAFDQMVSLLGWLD